MCVGAPDPVLAERRRAIVVPVGAEREGVGQGSGTQRPRAGPVQREHHRLCQVAAAGDGRGPRGGRVGEGCYGRVAADRAHRTG